MDTNAQYMQNHFTSPVWTFFVILSWQCFITSHPTRSIYQHITWFTMCKCKPDV